MAWASYRCWCWRLQRPGSAASRSGRLDRPHFPIAEPGDHIFWSGGVATGKSHTPPREDPRVSSTRGARRSHLRRLRLGHPTWMLASLRLFNAFIDRAKLKTKPYCLILDTAFSRSPRRLAVRSSQPASRVGFRFASADHCKIVAACVWQLSESRQRTK